MKATSVILSGLFGGLAIALLRWARSANSSEAPPAVNRSQEEPPHEIKSTPGGAAAACLRALRDADAAFPGRSKASDGIMGDASHQARKSDHNAGNAFDVTHDPDHGLDARRIAELALTDARTKYVISNGQIWNNQLGDKTWRKYDGTNPHTHHCHVSILETARDDDRHWPWYPGEQA